MSSSLKERLIGIPLVRGVARSLWKLSRDLPRAVPVEKIPGLREWSGRPGGFASKVGDFLSPSLGSEEVVRSGGTYERAPVIPIGENLPEKFLPPQAVEWADERVFVLRGCRFVGGYGGSIITPDNRIVAELSPDVWGIEKHRLFNRFKLPTIRELPGVTVILTTPEADANYSHWMVDMLPRLQLLAEAGWGPERVDRYLINRGNASYESETLALTGIPADKIQTVDGNAHFSCETLVTTSLRARHWQASMPGRVPDFLKTLVPSRAPEGVPSRKLFLTRRNCAFRRVLNESELEPMLREHGFKVVDPGSLDVKAQAQLFSEARAVFSPHSSALTNLAFCQSGTFVAEFLPADYFDVSFWTMASATGCRYTGWIAPPERTKPATTIEARRQDLSIPKDVLEAAIRLEEASFAERRAVSR